MLTLEFMYKTMQWLIRINLPYCIKIRTYKLLILFNSLFNNHYKYLFNHNLIKIINISYNNLLQNIMIHNNSISNNIIKIVSIINSHNLIKTISFFCNKIQNNLLIITHNINIMNKILKIIKNNHKNMIFYLSNTNLKL